MHPQGRRKLGIIQVFRRSFPPELSDRYRVSARITLYRSVCSNKKIAGEKLLRTATDAIFAKDKAQGPDHPDGYPTPATQYFTNKCAAAAIVSLIYTAQGCIFTLSVFVELRWFCTPRRFSAQKSRSRRNVPDA